MRSDTRHTHQALIAGALGLIDRDLDDDLGLTDLAERVGISPFHFHRLFSAIVGEPPASYIRRLRLERAARELAVLAVSPSLRLTSRLSVTEIAFRAGYETHEAFTRAFKARFGVPPCRFRTEGWSVDEAVEIEPAIVHVPSRRIAFVRHVGPYSETRAAFQKVVEWARRRGLLAGATLLGVYWDDQRVTPADRTRCEVGLMVDEYAVAEGEVGVRNLPAGDHVVFRHHGSSHDRRRGYDVVHARWLPERGRVPANAPSIEVYSTYRGALGSLDLVTSVHVPLVPKGAEDGARP